MFGLFLCYQDRLNKHKECDSFKIENKPKQYLLRTTIAQQRFFLLSKK